MSTANVPDPAESYVPPPVPPGIVRSLRALKAVYPELLEKYPRRWVACDATGVLFIGDSQEVLYKKCLDRGLHPEAFIVDYMMPGTFDDIDPDCLRDPD